jgi:protein-tyrosine phosphatase
MFDLHSHILPNIDDGAKNMEMSLAMLQIATENGTKGIVATPHVIEGEWLPAWDKILTECAMLQKAAHDAGLDLEIFPGGEVAIYRDILDLLTGPGAYCINNGRYLLVELPATHIPSFTGDFFFILQVRGITPILAHPERHPELAGKPEILAEWIGKGILSQMNSTSITGLMGERVMATAELLLTNNMVHVIGSDAHNIRHRNTNLTAAVDKITRLIGPEQAQRLLVVNPDNIIHNQDVDIPEIGAIEYPKENGGVMNWLIKLWK